MSFDNTNFSRKELGVVYINVQEKRSKQSEEIAMSLNNKVSTKRKSYQEEIITPKEKVFVQYKTKSKGIRTAQGTIISLKKPAIRSGERAEDVEGVGAQLTSIFKPKTASICSRAHGPPFMAPKDPSNSLK